MGAERIQYPEDWSSLRQKALQRDRYRCKNCGSTVNLNVHHIVPLSNGGSNSLDNLATICDRCHSGVHPHMRIRYYEKSAPLFMSNYKELRQFHSDEQLAIELKPTARILTLGLILTVLTGLTIILLPLTVIIGAIVLYVYLAEVRTKHYLVTSRRIILFQKSFWSDMGNRRDTYFDEIKDFTVIQSFRGKLFGYGGIKPVTIIAPPTARGMKEMKMARTRVERLEIMGGIRDPYRVRSQIQGVFRRVPERSNV